MRSRAEALGEDLEASGGQGFDLLLESSDRRKFEGSVSHGRFCAHGLLGFRVRPRSG
ncbi:MAG: hypothetical protein KGO47_04315 [Cyanobacteria bacterium REEB417]|nr:hypothetical protein [Cyanobacteria bacterium REEB417]